MFPEEDAIEQVEVFEDVTYSWPDEEGKTRFDRASAKLEEIQMESTITRVVYAEGGKNVDTILMLFYKPGKPKQMEKMFLIDSFLSDCSSDRNGMDGKAWMNSELKRIQKDHRITHVVATMADKDDGQMIVFCVNKK